MAWRGTEEGRSPMTFSVEPSLMFYHHKQSVRGKSLRITESQNHKQSVRKKASEKHEQSVRKGLHKQLTLSYVGGRCALVIQQLALELQFTSNLLKIEQ